MKIFAQNHAEDLQPLYKELDSLFADENIPSNLFELADSLLALENARLSALNLSVAYVSEVVSAGRTSGFDQFGFCPSATFFHHSGLQGGATGFWSSEFEPAYYLTDINLGYTKTLKKFTIQINHDFYLYNDTLKDQHLFDKAAQGSISYNLKHIGAGLEYSFLYGNSNAHRIVANANATFKIKTKGLVRGITFMPGASFQWGNANVYFLRQPRTALTDLYWLIRDNDYPRLERGDYRRLAYLLEQQRTTAAALFLRQRAYSFQQIEALLDDYYAGSISSTNTFGFMNMSVSFPVVLRAGKFSLLLNYTYNIPQRLPGESYTFEANGYFSSSLSYLISLRNK